MIAGIYNMLIEQGTTFVRSFNIQYPDPEDPEVYLNYDLTGYTARMQIRRTIDSSTAIVTCTTENGRISIDDYTLYEVMKVAIDGADRPTTNDVLEQLLEVINHPFDFRKKVSVNMELMQSNAARMATYLIVIGIS